MKAENKILEEARSNPGAKSKLSEVSGETMDSLVMSVRLNGNKRQRFSEGYFLKTPSSYLSYSPRVTRDY